MKVRWREHEMIFVTILVVAQIIFSLLKMYNTSYEQSGIDYVSGFKENSIPFIYWRNVCLPQIGAPLLMYLCYLSINLLVFPSVKKISFTDFEKLLTLNILKPILAIIVISYLLAIGVNVISYYAQPHLFNYGNYQLLALLGYNNKPLTDIFFGFNRALGIVMLFVVLAGIRELIIGVINSSRGTREFRVLIANNVTPLLFVYLLILFFLNPIHDRFMDYLAWVTPVLVLYLYNTFWLFPYKENYSWLKGAVLFRLIASTFIGALLSAIVFSGSNKLVEILFYWLFLLLVVTPLSWLLYQQRKDKILQLKGIETALAKSNADLQFLRSQINPHFLFNVLNTLYGTALKEQADHSAKGIQKLGDMMRFMLYENNLDFISMDKEIGYLKNYIDLQKLRTQSSPDIIVEDNMDEATCNRTIAPMILIPFVENAFKHGISLKAKSWINISLRCVETNIFFEVRNSIHKRIEADTEENKRGIGLKNVAERLKLLYPGKHDLRVSEDRNEFIIKLIIK